MEAEDQGGAVGREELGQHVGGGVVVVRGQRVGCAQRVVPGQVELPEEGAWGVEYVAVCYVG